jgi:hypothetical protein
MGELVGRRTFIAAVCGAAVILPAVCILVAVSIPHLSSRHEPPPSAQKQAIQEQPIEEQTGREQLAGEQTTAEQTVQQEATASAPDQEPDKDQARLAQDYAPEPVPLSYLAYYAYSEVPPDTKPADTLLNTFWNTREGTPVEEIERASQALGLDPVFMKAVAKIESGFDPKQRTGSYIGLFQLSNHEFELFGSGDITDARANAVAAVYKFTTAAILFELNTHKKPTLYDLYLIHQQGTQGAEEHVKHPERIAWQSMCATDEGREKGEKWCKRAIWQNTLPDVKKIWKSVENMTSEAFVAMWQDRVDLFYSRYSQALTAQ